MKTFFDFSNFRGDLFGGITAGIVALPLALAFGEQSGLGAAAGLYGVAFLAFFAALFGGTPSQISSPTAPMTALVMVIVADIVQAFEGKMPLALPAILFVFLLSGFFQFIFGAIKLGTFIRYIPRTVVSGFTTGIGVIIILTQLLPALGYYSARDKDLIEQSIPNAEELILERILREEAEDGILVLEDFKGTIEQAEKISRQEIMEEATALASRATKGALASLKFLPRAFSQVNWVEFWLSFSTILIIYGFRRITRVVPAALVALLIVTTASYYLNLDYVKIQEIPMGLPAFQMDIFSQLSWEDLSPFILTSLMLALLGTIDTLLTSVVADHMTATQHDPNKELMGQGIGNGIGALFGGIPGAGATVLTVVNIQAGGRTRLSGMVSGLFIFGILLALGPLASKVPAAVLAGILITVGIGVIDYRGLREWPDMELSGKLILLTVLLLTVFWQLVYAVAIGLVMAALVFMKKMADSTDKDSTFSNFGEVHEAIPFWNDKVSIPERIQKRVVFKDLNGPIFFGFVTNFKNQIQSLDADEIDVLVLRMDEVPFMDQSGVFALEQVLLDLQRNKVLVAISGARPQVLAIMRKMKVFPQVVSERFIFQSEEKLSHWLREVVTTDGFLEDELDAFQNPMTHAGG